MNEEKQTLSTYVEPELADAVRREAEDRAVSVAAVIRWALMEYFDAQLKEWREMAASAVCSPSELRKAAAMKAAELRKAACPSTNIIEPPAPQ